MDNENKGKAEKRYSPEVERMVEEAKTWTSAKQAQIWTKQDFANALKELLEETDDCENKP